jgi:hypothetical protein
MSPGHLAFNARPVKIALLTVLIAALGRNCRPQAKSAAPVERFCRLSEGGK